MHTRLSLEIPQIFRSLLWKKLWKLLKTIVEK